MLDLHPASFYPLPAIALYPPSEQRPCYGIISWGLYRQYLGTFFPEYLLSNPLSSRISSQLDGVLAWGTKPSSLSASALANRLSIPLLRIEDGFLYGLEPASPRMSLIVDDLGIYYDARHPSRLESLIADPLNPDQITRAKSARELWIKNGVSKYNHAPNWIRNSDSWFKPPFILLIDQTLGDQSISGALADASSFSIMLEAALSQTEIEHIVIKVHPEVVRGTKLGYFDVSPGSAISRNPRILVMADDYSLPSVVKEASAVYTVSSQAGFEALLWGKQVHTFGMPFYAGWGLTKDYLPRIERRRNVTLEQLIHAALITYPRYLHPETNQLCEIEDLIAYLGFQRMMRGRFGKPLMPVGFSRNKLRHLKRFTRGAKWIDENRLTGSLSINSTIDSDVDPHIQYNKVIWGSPNSSAASSQNDCLADLPNQTRLENQVKWEYIQVEDGFIRSIGLGAALARPYSWVLDAHGIYYDARSTNDLERLLQSTLFNNSILARASLLKEQLIDLEISKYNLKHSSNAASELAALQNARRKNPARSFLLVIGQVETDASIKYGGIDILTNLELLKAVRNAYPDAFIIYKPHPDIAESVRFSGGEISNHQDHLDLAIFDLDLLVCLQWIDSLHTISSLSGFEALIRGVPVYCYGLPFYAGWGLTHDRHNLKRRTRKLDLLELIAGTLILYPSYLHPKSNLYCTPEALITALNEIKNTQAAPLTRLFDYLIYKTLRLMMGLSNRLKGI